MEKDQTARTREQVAAAVRGKAEAGDREVVSQQDRVVTAYAKTAVKRQSIDREIPVMIRNAPSAAALWYENSYFLVFANIDELVKSQKMTFYEFININPTAERSDVWLFKF